MNILFLVYWFKFKWAYSVSKVFTLSAEIRILMWLLIMDLRVSPVNGERVGRMLGGTRAKPEEFPWTVSIQKNCGNGIYQHFCGSGTILDELSIVTAAHCVWNKKPEMLQILAGVVNFIQVEPDHQRVDVEKILVHPKYTTGNEAGSYDIAILKLQFALNWTKSVQPIEVIDPGQLSSTTNCTTVGWGNQFPFSKIFYFGSEVLLKLDTRVISKRICHLAYPFLQGALETAICATSGFLKGTCQGDSGGALICESNRGIQYLVGLVSWGWFVCGDGIHPDIFTDLSLFHNFTST